MSNQDDANPFARTTPPTATPDPVTNPYVPTSDMSSVAQVVGNDPESIRRHYLSHEASVKSIGTLYLLGAIIMIPVGFFIMLAPLFSQQEELGIRVVMGVMGLLYLSLGLLQGFTAVSLWKLRPWARIVAIVLSVIGLIGFPIGTLISAYFLYLLLSEKGQMVFSPGYQQVVAQTPHIKYKTSIIVWIFLGLLICLIAFGVIAAVAGG
ncbi:hypothetical protein SH528x_006814 [Novipirellula sp. SH528]|uniref:hypothetical protein n=1 Tax=Novipirellula sp. SH528 TaxID=3454466 RepID=UPI003FA146AD